MRGKLSLLLMTTLTLAFADVFAGEPAAPMRIPLNLDSHSI